MTTNKQQPIKTKRNDIILAIYPNSIGFGYAIIDNVKNPIDYGIVNLRIASTKRYIKKAQQIIEEFKPTVLILEDYSCKSFRKSHTIKQIIQALKTKAGKAKLPVHVYCKKDIRDAFTAFNANSKYEIAKVIISWLPELEKIPLYKRKAWEGEPYTMTMFDAFALALTHFYLE